MMRIGIVALLVLLVACGAQEQGEGPVDPTAVPTPDAQTVTGTLAGDPQLEGGCVWLETGDGRIEVLWPDGYQASADPVQLVGPDGAVVAEEGDEVTVRGAPAEDVMSICMVGEIWQAEEVA